MSDIQLLKDAAKAAGIELDWDIPPNAKNPWRMTGEKETEDYGPACEWNPLTDDGDALRLAVKLKLPFNITDRYARCIWGSFGNGERCDEFHSMEGATNDPYEATRRAIVRAAAEIGQTK